MAKLVSDVISMARFNINDPNAARFSAAKALEVYNRTLHRLLADRPDLFVGSAFLSAPADKVAGDTVPYEDQFAQLHADMMVAEFETMPDEEQNAMRAEMFDARARR